MLSTEALARTSLVIEASSYEAEKSRAGPHQDAHVDGALLDLIMRQRALAGQRASQAIDRPTSDGGTIRWRTSRMVIGAAALMAVAILVPLFLFGTQWGRDEQGPPSRADERSLAATGGTVEPSTATTPTAGSPKAALVVELTTRRPVWVRIEVDDQPPVSRVVPASETLSLEAGATVSIRFGDAGAVRVRVNGEDLGFAGPDGSVLTRRYDTADSRFRSAVPLR